MNNTQNTAQKLLELKNIQAQILNGLRDHLKKDDIFTMLRNSEANMVDVNMVWDRLENKNRHAFQRYSSMVGDDTN